MNDEVSDVCIMLEVPQESFKQAAERSKSQTAKLFQQLDALHKEINCEEYRIRLVYILASHVKGRDNMIIGQLLQEYIEEGARSVAKFLNSSSTSDPVGKLLGDPNSGILGYLLNNAGVFDSKLFLLTIPPEVQHCI